MIFGNASKWLLVACVNVGSFVLGAATAAAAAAVPSVAAASAPTAARPQDRPIGPQLPLVFAENWKNSAGSVEHFALQADVANPDLELKLYGPSGKQIEMGGTASPPGGRPTLPPHLWTGLCEQTCAAALRDKNNYVDLSGFGKIRWYARVSGPHAIHPIVKLADGTWLLGDHEDHNELDLHPSEFTLTESRWIRLDIDKVVTRGRWLERSELDLSKVDEVGFTDLMPGSGHGDGGWTDMGWIEVYGKPVPRANP